MFGFPRKRKAPKENTGEQGLTKRLFKKLKEKKTKNQLKRNANILKDKCNHAEESETLKYEHEHRHSKKRASSHRGIENKPQIFKFSLLSLVGRCAEPLVISDSEEAPDCDVGIDGSQATENPKDHKATSSFLKWRGVRKGGKRKKKINGNSEKENDETNHFPEQHQVVNEEVLSYEEAHVEHKLEVPIESENEDDEAAEDRRNQTNVSYVFHGPIHNAHFGDIHNNHYNVISITPYPVEQESMSVGETVNIQTENDGAAASEGLFETGSSTAQATPISPLHDSCCFSKDELDSLQDFRIRRANSLEVRGHPKEDSRKFFTLPAISLRLFMLCENNYKKDAEHIPMETFRNTADEGVRLRREEATRV